MPLLTEEKLSAATETKDAVTDRRRPGRRSSVSAELIPILRNQSSDPIIDFDEQDQGSAIRGLFYATILAIPMWVAIYYFVSALLTL